MSDHYYDARGVHSAIFDMTDPEILISGPQHTGSDRACMEKMATECWAHPGMRGLIARKIEKTHALATRPLMEREVLREMMAGPRPNVEYFKGSYSAPQSYRFSNGSTIYLAGVDDSKKLVSNSYDMITVTNATDLELEDWEDLTLTLDGDVLGYTQMLATTLPQWPTHWLYLRGQTELLSWLESRHENNPKLFTRENNGGLKITDHGRMVLQRLKGLTGVRWLRNGLGLWAPAEGLIYTRFDSAVHVIKPYVVPNDWARVWGIDWGLRHPFSWGNWVREPDGRLVLFQEIHMMERTVAEHAETILNATTRQGQPRPEKIICDHDAAARMELEAILSREWGFRVETVPAKKAVKAGIDAFDNRLKLRDIAIMHGALLETDQVALDLGKPIDLISEINSYIWADEKRDQPLKRDDDAVDMGRYVVMEEDAITARGIRMKRAVDA